MEGSGERSTPAKMYVESGTQSFLEWYEGMDVMQAEEW